MPRLGVVLAATASLAAFHGAFRERASAHGLRLGQPRGEVTNGRRDSVGIAHEKASYGKYSRRRTNRKPHHAAFLTILTCAPSHRRA